MKRKQKRQYNYVHNLKITREHFLKEQGYTAEQIENDRIIKRLTIYIERILKNEKPIKRYLIDWDMSQWLFFGMMLGALLVIAGLIVYQLWFM